MCVGYEELRKRYGIGEFANNNEGGEEEGENE